MKRNVNKYRHKWKEEGVGTYSYRCEKCRCQRIKGSAYTYSYKTVDSFEWISRSPECIEIKKSKTSDQ